MNTANQILITQANDPKWINIKISTVTQSGHTNTLQYMVSIDFARICYTIFFMSKSDGPSANSQIHSVLYMIYELQDLWILWCDHPGMYNYFSYYSDVIMSAVVSQITGVSIVCSNVYSGRRRSKKISKLCVTGLCEGNPSVTGRFPSQKASYTKTNSMWWRHHADAQW